MVEIINRVIEIVEYSIEGLLLYYYMKDYVLSKKMWKYAHIVLILQYMGIQVFLHSASSVRRLLYGKDMIIESSRQSIIVLAVSLFFTLIFTLVLTKGRNLVKMYLVLTFYSIMELCRFIIYSIMIIVTDRWVHLAVFLFERKFIKNFASLQRLLEINQFLFNNMFSIGMCLLLWFILKRHKYYLSYIKNQLANQELLFLSIPSLVGLILAILLRSILFIKRDGKMYDLYSNNAQMYFIVPAIILLCLISIVLSSKVLKELVEYHEEKKLRMIYENQMSDMKKHIEDMEQLYDGIRGMKHDLKNYTFEIEALLSLEKEDHGEYQSEINQYLQGIYTSLDKFDMKYKTGNPIIDVVLNRKYQQAKENEITFTSNLIYPKNLNISAFDLSIILNNALDNALEACMNRRLRIDKNDTFITLNAYQKGKMFFIEVNNNFHGSIKYQDHKKELATTKTDQGIHGMGIKNIRNCADKYFGELLIEVKEDVFQLTIMLQG
ncbi:ATP-binding protein [Anaeromicropila herbilytica]|uniref:Sensor histidine kinase n=1 Tax=Anaeromicropila herbilytica TaxID=2785025 RepID=A0A7R7EIM5_9FIRM|nr:ATP-binding protein [Anaeromicropila herbilytica]BCN29424.1 sensor histidine kinase [Anaeromicropila herbilytica]